MLDPLRERGRLPYPAGAETQGELPTTSPLVEQGERGAAAPARAPSRGARSCLPAGTWALCLHSPRTFPRPELDTSAPRASKRTDVGLESAPTEPKSQFFRKARPIRRTEQALPGSTGPPWENAAWNTGHHRPVQLDRAPATSGTEPRRRRSSTKNLTSILPLTPTLEDRRLPFMKRVGLGALGGTRTRLKNVSQPLHQHWPLLALTATADLFWVDTDRSIHREGGREMDDRWAGWAAAAGVLMIMVGSFRAFGRLHQIFQRPVGGTGIHRLLLYRHHRGRLVDAHPRHLRRARRTRGARWAHL